MGRPSTLNLVEDRVNPLLSLGLRQLRRVRYATHDVGFPHVTPCASSPRAHVIRHLNRSALATVPRRSAPCESARAATAFPATKHKQPGEHADAGAIGGSPVEWAKSFPHPFHPEEPSHARQTPTRPVQR
jgi:hypothetical protein